MEHGTSDGSLSERGGGGTLKHLYHLYCMHDVLMTSQVADVRHYVPPWILFGLN